MKKKGFSKVITILFFSVILVGCSGKSLEETKWLLRESIYKNDLNEVKSIISENPELVNTKYDYDRGDSPLAIATRESQVEIVQFLIAHGADVNFKRDRGITPLHNAAVGGEVEIVELLIAKGANVNVTCDKGITPLIIAAIGGDMDVIEILINQGANINAKDDFGRSPLHIAIEYEYDELADFLRKQGAVESIHNEE